MVVDTPLSEPDTYARMPLSGRCNASAVVQCHEEQIELKHFRIQMDDPDSRERAFYEMMRRGRIVCLRGNQFIVPEPALELLDELETQYTLFAEDDPEPTLRAVRNPVAASQ